jgi:hypothetical protein
LDDLVRDRRASAAVGAVASAAGDEGVNSTSPVLSPPKRA